MKIYSSSDIKKWDAFTIQNEPIRSIDLMERASQVFTRNLLSKYSPKKVLVVCGTGNNGGDGFAIARLLYKKEISVTVWHNGLPKTPDAQSNFDLLDAKISKVDWSETKPEIEIEADLIIDAVFGIGIKGKIKGVFVTIIHTINASSIPIVSVDVPSGLEVDKFEQNGTHTIVKASLTITFQSLKKAYLFANSEKFTGSIRVVDIGLSTAFNKKPWTHLISPEDFSKPKRSSFDHKGTHGKLLLVGGFNNMNGSIILSALGGYKAGCGYVYVHSDFDTKTLLLNHIPEAIFQTDLKTEGLDCVAVGMGLGTATKSLAVLKTCLKLKKQMVIDADALNLISSNQKLLSKVPKNSILTPHKMELSRLLNLDTPSESELLEGQIKLSKKFSIYIIQKGKFSKLSTPEGEILVNPTGNEGMGVAGMGDVLAGIIGSLLAQGYSPKQAAIFGMYWHGKSADQIAWQRNKTGILASEVAMNLPNCI